MLAALALVVRDYDEAIAFFTEALRFTLLEDTPLGDGKRWVRVAPTGFSSTKTQRADSSNLLAVHKRNLHLTIYVKLPPPAPPQRGRDSAPCRSG